MSQTLIRAGLIGVLAVLTGCASQPERQVDYSAFRASKPASILVLPPVNDSVEPAAVAAVLSQVTFPLAESGYYVVPVAVMEETFRQNGVTSAEDARQIPAAKLREIFGADAALMLTIKQYGSSYQVVSSQTVVQVDAVLGDLRTGTKLWEGSHTVSPSSNSGDGGLLGMLVGAVVEQISSTLTDRSFKVAQEVTMQLLMAGTPTGPLYGPRSPHYEFK